MTEQNWADHPRAAHHRADRRLHRSDCRADRTPLLDDDFLVLINGCWEPLTFTIPPRWRRVTGRSCVR
jgi:glycogen operon protein